MKEIDKIGKIIEAILMKIGILKTSGERESVHSQTKIELAEKLNIDIDDLVAREDFPGILVREYGFSDANLGKFIQLMLDFIETAHDTATAEKYTFAALAIYSYLGKNASNFSFDNYYIMEELKKYM